MVSMIRMGKIEVIHCAGGLSIQRLVAPSTACRLPKRKRNPFPISPSAVIQIRCQNNQHTAVI